MINNKLQHSPRFEISVYKRDALGDIKSNEPKESYCSDYASEISDFYERKVGFFQRKQAIARRKKKQERELQVEIKRQEKNKPRFSRNNKSKEELPTNKENLSGRQLFETIRQQKRIFIDNDDTK